VLVFKYTDAAGKNFISMKSKGSVYLTNGPFGTPFILTLLYPINSLHNLIGAFATLAKKVLGIRGPRDVIAFNSLPEALKELAEENIQSKTFELVGNECMSSVPYRHVKSGYLIYFLLGILCSEAPCKI